MKKVIFMVFGLLAAFSMHAGNYELNADGKSYEYTGTPVDEFYVDFQQWTTDALPGTWTDDAELVEVENIGFVKWNITSRTLKHDGVSVSGGVNCAFNNGTTSDGIKNNATANRPRIYLPTTAKGVKAIKAVMSCNMARGLAVNYKDDNHSTWTYTSDQVLTAGAAYEGTEAVVMINTTGPTSIYLEYSSTDYFGVVSIELEMEEEEEEPVPVLPDDTKNLYVLESDGYYHYNGEAVEDVYMDFSDLTAADAYYSTDQIHKDTLFVFMETLGMYKWCYYKERTITGGDTYGPVAWNNGTSENGKNSDIKTSAPEKLPAIYFPEIKTGIKQLVVEGWTNNGSDRNLIVDYEDADGNWKTLNSLNIDPYYATIKTNTYSSDTVNINNTMVRRIRFWRNSNEYQFLTKVQIIAMPATETDIDNIGQNANDKVVKYIRDGRLYIRRNGQIYNAQGCKL